MLPYPQRVGSVTDRPLPPQGYRLVINEAGAPRIAAGDAAGEFYARQTLAQLGPRPRPVVIEDWPDIAVRGVMLDVSRDKVPTMETLVALVDRLASWKINQLQLYMEHTYAYASHPDVWRDASPFTPGEVRDLDAHCRARHVELVPNQNCLGHMERWLRLPRYRPMAIRPDGWVDARGRAREPTTLDPGRPESLAFVRSLLAELLPSFSSRRVHVGLDEPWELPAERYQDYVSFVRALRASPELDGREMLMWGDIVASQSDSEGSTAGDVALPEGVTVCEWGYEATHPFEARAAALSAAGVPFWVCPGTSSWNSLVGRWSNMRANCLAAARAAVAAGAGGFLVTDWGDNGHLQYLPVSEPALAWAAAVSWNSSAAGAALASVDVFGDPTGELLAALAELGDAQLSVWPQVPNSSALALAVLSPRVRMGEGFTAGMTVEDLDAASAVIDRASARLSRATPSRADGALVMDEVRASAELLALLVEDARCRLRAGGRIEDVSATVRRSLAARLEPMIDRHRSLWLARNRPGGLDDSCSRLARLLDVYRGSS